MRSPVRYVSLGFQSGSLGQSHTFEVIRISVVIEVGMEKWAREIAQKVPVGRTLIIFFRLAEKDVKEDFFFNLEIFASSLVESVRLRFRR